jgi:hypothetical protein
MTPKLLRLLTDVLDLIGLLGLVAAAAIAVAPFTLPGAVAVAGAGVLAVSWLFDRRAKASRPRGEQ